MRSSTPLSRISRSVAVMPPSVALVLVAGACWATAGVARMSALVVPISQRRRELRVIAIATFSQLGRVSPRRNGEAGSRLRDQDGGLVPAAGLEPARPLRASGF